MNVGRNIKLIRKKQGMTLDQLAAEIGVTKSTVARYESGDIKYVSSDMISKIADALNCRKEEILGKDPDYVSSGASSEEAELLNMYSNLTAEQKKTIRFILSSWQ